jgi:hypothetical protein
MQETDLHNVRTDRKRERFAPNFGYIVVRGTHPLRQGERLPRSLNQLNYAKKH